MKLPGDVLVFPAHGAGSLCGRNMRAERSSTIATECMTNYVLQIGSREEFIRELTSKVPVRPDYFLQDAGINRDGAAPLSEMKEVKPLSPQALKGLLDQASSLSTFARPVTSQKGTSPDRSTSRSPASSPLGPDPCWDCPRARDDRRQR